MAPVVPPASDRRHEPTIVVTSKPVAVDGTATAHAGATGVPLVAADKSLSLMGGFALARSLSFTFLVHPYDVIRMRMHAPTSHYGSSWECARALWKQQGMRGFFRGASVPFFGHYFTSNAFMLSYSYLCQRRIRELEVDRLREQRLRELERVQRERDRWERKNLWEKSVFIVDEWLVAGGIVVPPKSTAAPRPQQDFERWLDNSGGLPVTDVMTYAAAGGVAAAFISCPLDLIRSRYVTADLFPHRQYKGVVDAFLHVFRHGGIVRLYRGLPSSIARDSLGWMLLMGVYGNWRRLSFMTDPYLLAGVNTLVPPMRSALRSVSRIMTGGAPVTMEDEARHRRGDDKPITVVPPELRGFIGGAIAGIVQWIAVLPIEKVKTVVQTSHSDHRIYTFEAIALIRRKYGMKGFYRGFPVTMLRAAAVGSITFAFAENRVQAANDETVASASVR